LAWYTQTKSFLNQKMEISYSLKTRVFDYMKAERLVQEHDTVVIGVSGGADSVCLLFLLLELSSQLNIRIRAVHVHHGIRGNQADADADYVAGLCERLQIPLSIQYVDAPGYATENNLTLEEAARILRYRALTELAGDGLIAVAHHRDDQAETMLFQMLRGSSVRGLGGMRPRRDRIIRPLLCLSREEILTYLKENNISYQTDETNFDNAYSRNRIRNEVLPIMTEIQPQAVKHMAALAEDLQEMDAYLRSQAEAAREGMIQTDERGIIFDTDAFLKLNPIIRRTVVAMAFEQLVIGRKDIGRIHISQVAELVEKESGKEITLPYGMKAVKEGRTLTIFREAGMKDAGAAAKTVMDISAEGQYVLEDQRELTTRIFPKSEGLQIPRDAYTKWFDYDKIKFGLQIRNRQPGDYLCIDAQMHHKKLQDYFVNTKIPGSKRDKCLLLADGDHILWVIGGRISEYYKVSEETEYILEIKLQEAAYERENQSIG